MKKNIPNKIYELLLLFTALLVGVNIAGLWVTWNTGNCFGYVVGAFVIAFLLADAILAFLNQKPSVRKHAVIWLLYLILHIVFFALATYLSGAEDKAVPALFTVMLVAIILSIGWILLKHRLIKGHKTYQLVNETESEAVEEKEKHEFNNTVKVEFEKEKDTDLAEQKEDESEEKIEPVSTGVISL